MTLRTATLALAAALLCSGPARAAGKAEQARAESSLLSLLKSDGLLSRDFVDQVGRVTDPAYLDSPGAELAPADPSVTFSADEDTERRIVKLLGSDGKFALEKGSARELVDAVARALPRILAEDSPEASLGALPPSTLRMGRHTALQIIRLILAHPELIPESGPERKALNNFFTQGEVRPNRLDVLVHLARSAAKQAGDDPQSELGRRIGRIRTEMELGAIGGDPAALRARLERFMDGAREGFARSWQEAEAARTDAVGASAPQAGLQKPAQAETAPMDRVALEAYLGDPNDEGNERLTVDKVDKALHGVEGLKVASFLPGDFRPEYLAMLREMKVDLVVLRQPSPKEVRDYRRFMTLTPKGIEWVQSVGTTNGFLDALKRRGIDGLRRLLPTRKAAIEVDLDTLDVVGWEKEYYPLHKRIITAKQAGKLFAKEGHVPPYASNGRGFRIFYRDAVTKELRGGYIMEAFTDPETGKTVWGHFAAYDPVTKPWSVDTRSIAEGINLARWLGISVYSAGIDGVIKGFYRAFGLMLHKIGLAFGMYPVGEFQGVHVLNPEKFRLEKNADGLNEGLGLIEVPPGSDLERAYFDSWEAGAPKKAHQLLRGSYLGVGTMAMRAALRIVHYYTDPAFVIPTPEGLDAPVRRPLDSLNSYQ